LIAAAVPATPTTIAVVIIGAEGKEEEEEEMDATTFGDAMLFDDGVETRHHFFASFVLPSSLTLGASR
jgi:uncharacterized cupin superfamily protein